MTDQKIQDAEAAAALKIIEKAVREAVETVGLEGVKMLSMFLSNARTDDCRGSSMTYEIPEPRGGWKTTFTDAEKAKLRPIAETLAMLDGNAFFGIEDSDDREWYEQYLPEAHALYEANGGDRGWAGRASFVSMTITDAMVERAIKEYVLGDYDTPEQAMRGALKAAWSV